MDSELGPERGGGKAPVLGTQQVCETTKALEIAVAVPSIGAREAQGGTRGDGEGAETGAVGETVMAMWHGKGVVNTGTVTGTMTESTTGTVTEDQERDHGGRPEAGRPMALPWH